MLKSKLLNGITLKGIANYLTLSGLNHAANGVRNTIVNDGLNCKNTLKIGF